MKRTVPAYPGTQAIRRAVRVLRAFSEAKPELALAEVTALAGLSKSTTYRLLMALVEEGLVERARGREAYRLGPELVALGARALRSSDLRVAARPELERLVQEVGETASLEVLVEGDVMVVDEVNAPGLMGTRADIGTRWPAFATSTGKVLLAAAEAAGKPVTLPARAKRSDVGPCALGTVAALREEMARARVLGYGTAFDELQEGYAAAAAAVRDHEGRVVAAVGVGGATIRLTRDRLRGVGERVRRAAERISERLGAARRGE